MSIFSLLAQNKVSEFHTEIERLEPAEIHDDIYIKHPIQIEQYLMEGNYNKVSFFGKKKTLEIFQKFYQRAFERSFLAIFLQNFKIFF